MIQDYFKKNVGKVIKNSKIKYTWVISTNEKIYNLNLFESKMSGKYRIFIDEKLYKMIDKKNKNLEEIIELDNNKIKINKNNKNQIEISINDKNLNYIEIKDFNKNLNFNEIEKFNKNIDFLENTEIKKFSKNLKDYIYKKEIEMNDKEDYHYI